MIVAYAVSVVVFLWLVGITIVVYKIKKHYANLVKRTNKTSIDEILDTLLKNDGEFKTDISQIEKQIKELGEGALLHYQKIGFLRFNAFERGGGEQSFVVAFLNGVNNGILLNFLYTREGIRVYAKKVTAGKSAEYELSLEEKEAIKKAQLL